MAQSVSKIAVVNNAAMDIQFKLDVSGLATAYTGYYPVGQTQSITVPSILAAGAALEISVHAEAGVTLHGTGIVYAANGNTATYSVTGTTQAFEVTPL